MNANKPFKPYIPADKVTPEITAVSVVIGVILAVVFGAANAYLGLRVGLTVSASIPAAVLSMGIIRVLMRRNSILESNIVQTIGSAGESLAAGAIFTLPALFLWAAEGKGEKPSLLAITVIALCGGILGVLFMVPLRNALIVREHATLPYPEGTACAEVLLAGEEGGAQAASVFSGLFNRAAQKLLHKPRVSHIHLDEMGSFVWPRIDGQHTVGQLADLAAAQFGPKADPVYPRMAKYIQILASYEFITLTDPGTEPAGR